MEELTALYMRQGANRWKAAARAKKVIEAREKKAAEADAAAAVMVDPVVVRQADWLQGRL